MIRWLEECTKPMIAKFFVNWMVWHVYFIYDFEAHENLSHKPSVLINGTMFALEMIVSQSNVLDSK